ncbi:aldo/keto reductase [Salininema proteolyticum]|uniref:Aldo/keto reductase n=1 Tax=Salininema proteolyticum TaxID=1607685 RepID=A0ABV8TZP2_9ACTN
MSDKRIPEARLGDGGPTTGAQGLGCMGMSEFYGPTDEGAARETLEAALEGGVTMFDTADMYGLGANEEFLAPFVKAHRDEVFLATKFGIERDPENRQARGFRGDRDYVRRSIEGSLRRLGVDHVDLYYMHRRDEGTPLEETVGAMAELVEEGKVRHIGLSEVTSAELREAHAVHPVTAVQSEWSLFSRDIEEKVVPAAAELGVALVPYSPLGRGFLTGQFTDAEKHLDESDFRRGHERFTGANAESNARLLEPVRAVAERHGVSPATVALAWVHGRASVHGLSVVPIPGTRKASRLRENLAAMDLELSEDDLAALEPIGAQVAGRRYPVGARFSSQDRE